MSQRLSNEEKETIITFDETSADAVVFTYNKPWQQHIEKRFGIKASSDNGFGGREYQVPKKRIRPPLAPRAPRKLSTEQRQKIAQRLARGRHGKSPDLSAGILDKRAGHGAKRKGV